MSNNLRENIPDDKADAKLRNKKYNDKFHHLGLRILPKDHKQIKEKAKKLGFITKTGKTNITKYVLYRALFDDTSILNELEDYRKIGFQIRKIGVNLNQLSRKMNQLSGSISTIDIEKQLFSIKNELRAILSKL